MVAAGAATTAAAATSCMDTSPKQSQAPEPRPADRQPVAFVSHGAPTLALDRVAGAELGRWATTLPRPSAILVVSAHWLDAPATIGTTTRRELLHDYAGFPAELGRVRYDSPAAAGLAARLLARLPELRQAPTRPWDHGVWVPLVHMFPPADLPVLQLSLPMAWSPRQLFELGRQLAPCRAEGVLVLGSGGMVHNLRRLQWQPGAGPEGWAVEFEGWVRDRLAAGAVDDLVAFRDKAPAVRLAHPTDDHFLPLLVALGAADGERQVRHPIEGFEYGSLSRLAVQFG